MTESTSVLSWLNRWHWSPEPPEEYVDASNHGIGCYAAHHPGAFNIAWALTGGLTATRYRMADAAEKLPLRLVTWIPTAVVMGFGLYSSEGFWDMFEVARRNSLPDFASQLTDARAKALADGLGFDFRQKILDCVTKH